MVNLHCQKVVKHLRKKEKERKIKATFCLSMVSWSISPKVINNPHI